MVQAGGDGCDGTAAFKEADDRALVEASRGGRREAFDELVVRHRKAVYQLCYRFTGNHQDASDLTQEAFLRAYRSLASFRGTAAFSTWLYRITMNACLSRVPKSQPQPDGLAVEQHADPTHVAADVTLVRAQLAARVRSAVSRLPKRQRATVILRVYHDLTHEQIARILGSSVGTVKANFFHALRNLRRMLGEAEN